MPFSNELLAAAGVTPESDKGTPPPYLNNDVEKKLNINQGQPQSLKDLAQARALKGLEKGMQLHTNNEQIKPYTYNAGADGRSFYKTYHAFGQETFDKIGFSPFKDNDAAFNAQTNFFDRAQRTLVHGFAPLFARGFVSGPKSLLRMVQGDFGDDPEDARKYAEAAAIAQDTSGGVGAFFNNSLMNFGYTAGIIGEAVAEELALTALTGGAGGVLNLPNFGSKLLRGARGIKGVGSVLDMTAALGKSVAGSVKSLTNVNKAREFFNAAKIGAAMETRVGRAAGRIANFANPAENLLETGIDIAKNVKQLQGWNRFNNAAFKTAGALYRDVRNINMALSEARLEGGFSRNDAYDQLVKDYRSRNNGKMPPQALRDAMMAEAEKASKDSMLANTLLIYASNKVTFGNVLNPKSGLSRMLSKKVAEVQKMAGQSTVREFTKKTLKSGKELLTPKLTTVKGAWATAKKQGLQKTVKAAIGYTKANLMEGAQEVLQEVIADTSKNYHLQAFYSQPASSYYYTKAQLAELKTDKTFGEILGEGFSKQASAQGLETFASGFVMGAFAYPLNRAIPFAQEKYMQVFKNDMYKAHKAKIDGYVDRMTKSVNNTMAKNPLDFLQSKVFTLGTQTELANVIDTGDTKVEKDAKEEAVIKNVTDLIKMDSLEIWTDYMESLKELTTEEYAEAVGITVEQAEGHVEKLDKVINRAKEIEKTYKQYNEKFPSPIDLNDYEEGTKEYEKASVYHAAWEEGKKNLIFYHENYKDTVTRMQSIYQAIAQEELLGKIDPNRVQALLKDDRMLGEIQILESEVEGLKGMTDSVSKKKLKETENTLGILKEYQQDYENFMSHFFEQGMVEPGTEEEKAKRLELDDQVINKLESSFKKYMKSLAKQSDDIILNDSIDDAFEKLVDYYKLGKEANKLSDAINMMNDPEGFMEHVDRTYDWMYEMWNNREDYIRENINKQLETLKFNQLLNDMAGIGIYVDLEAFAEFKETGVIPAEFFDDVNKRVIKKGSPIYEEVANRFMGLSVMQQILEANKPASEKQKEELARLDAEELSEINKLPKVPTKVVVRKIDNKKDFSINVINDQLSNGQSVDVTYEEDGVQKTAVFFKDQDGVLKYDNAEGEAVDLKLDIKFNSGEIFEILNRPTDEDVAEVKKTYDALRAEAAEKAIEEGIKPFTAEQIAELDTINADTPIEAMPPELKQQLVDAYDEYRARPENKSMFPDNLTEEDLQNKFATFIKSESEALEIIEKYVKDKKLQAATTPAGEVVVPSITLPNGEVISADDATDAILDTTLQRYRFLIAELGAKPADQLTDEERKNLAIYKSKANILSTYIENKRIGEMSPELQAAKAKIDLLLKEQEKIKAMKTGYDVEGDILRRVSNVIESLKGEKYAYKKMEDVRVAFNMTIGQGKGVDAFINQLREAKLPGFSEKTYEALAEEIKELMTITSADQDVLKLQLNSLREDLKVEEGEFGNPELAQEIRNQIAAIESQIQEEVPVETPVTYEELVATSRNQIGITGPNLSFIFFGNLQNAIKSGQIKSKEELNKIIADWNDTSGYQGYPNEMSDAQSNMLLQLSAGLPDVTPSEVKKAQQTPDTLLESVERAVTEKTYNEETDAGTYIDDLSKEFLAGRKPKFEADKISEEAYENLFGENGLFQIMKQWMDTNKLIIVSRGLVVYDKDANVAGEIDFLLSDGKNFYIVDLKTGKQDKWDKYNDPNSEYYSSKVSNTLQQASYVNLLYNMIGVKAIPKILPVETQIDRNTGKILKASRPSSANALKAGKILIDLPVSPEMQAQIDSIIPLKSKPTVSSVPVSPSVSNIVNKAEGEQAEPTDYEEGSGVPTGTPTDTSAKVKEYEDRINKAKDTDQLDFIELQLGMNSLDMTADELFQVQQMLEQKRSNLLSGGKAATQEKSWSIGNQVHSESTIFADKGKNRGEVFLEPFETAVISSIDIVKGTVTIKPYGKKNQKTISIDMLNKMFKLNSDLFTEGEAPTTQPANKDLQNLSKESTDVVSTLLNDVTAQTALEQEVAGENITVDETVNNLLDDLEC